MAFKSAHSKKKNVLPLGIRRWIRFFLVIPCVLFLFVITGIIQSPTYAGTGINKEINFQGKLVDNNGLNVADNTYTVIFSIYNVSSGGTATWTETDSVTTVNGVFQVLLGAGTTLPGSIDFNQDTWYLGIQVNSDAEMTPRVRLAAVPYAFNASTVGDVAGATNADGFQFSGGTTSRTLTVTGADITIGSTIKPTSAGGLTIDSNGSNALTLDTGGGAAINVGNGNATSIVFGNGTSNPTFSFSGSGTFGTSTGTNTLNGNVVIAAGKSLQITGGAGDPTATSGIFWYNTTTKKFEIVENGVVKVLCNTTDNGCGTGGSGGPSYWTLDSANGDIYPVNATLDLLVGGTATSSAKFGVLNIAGGTPVASVSATSSGTGLVLGGDGTIQATRMNNLTIGGAASGGVGTGDIILAPRNGGAGSTVTFDANTLALGGTNTVISNTGSNTLTLNSGSTGNINFFGTSNTLSSGGTLTLNGAIDLPNSNTLTGVGSYLELNNGLSVGGGTTYDITSGGVANLASGSNVINNGPSYFQVGSTASSGSYARMYADLNQVGDFALTDGNAVPYFYADVTGNAGSLIPPGAVAIGKNVTSPHAVLDVEGGNTGGNAALIVNQTGATTNDIFDASASGNTKFVINNSGYVGIGNSGPTYPLDLISTGSTQMRFGYDTSNYYTTAISSAGAVTFDATGSSAGFTFADNLGITSGGLTLGTTGSAGALITLDSAGGGIAAPTIQTDSSGNLTIKTNQSSTSLNLGSGSGNIQLALTNAGDGFIATKTVTLAGSYVGNDYTFDRVLTSGSNSTNGALVYVTDTGNGSGTINPDLLYVDSELTSGTFTGNLLRLRTAGVDKARVTYQGQLDLGGGLSADIDTITGATLTIGGVTQTGLTLGRSGATTTINGSSVTIPSGGLTLGMTSGSHVGSVTFDDGANSNTVSLQAGATSGTYTWTLPTADAAGCLRSNGSGTLSISACGDTDKQTFSASGNYTIPNNALMTIAEVWGSGGGGGGGAGGTTSSVRSGGAGGGGGAYAETTFTTSSLGSSGATVPVTVGGGGTSGGGGTNTGGTDGGAGNPSCVSTSSSCGGTMYLEAFGGGGGNGDGTAGNGGGGGGGQSAVGTTNATSATGGTGGNPLGASAGTQNSGGGGGGGMTAAANPTTAAVGSSNQGGGGGGASSTAGANAGGPGGGSVLGGAGGGGGATSGTTCAVRSGGAGGHVPGLSGGGGTAGSSSGGGGQGSDGVGSGGDGGGGGSNTCTASTTGGSGGQGGLRGGGGGGGGASTGTGTQIGGAGGVGGGGYVRITTLMGTGADLAEMYNTNDTSLMPGDVVAIDPTLTAGVQKSSKAYDSMTIGVVSTQPGLILADADNLNATRTVLVALTGRVPMKVSLENGPIESGDYLTPSSTPGVAMKATKAGVIIGQAMTSYSDPTAPNYIVAFIKNGFTNGSSLADVVPGLDTTGTDAQVTLEQQALTYLASSSATLASPSADLSEVVTDRLTAGLEVITPQVFTKTLATNTITSEDGTNISLTLSDNGQFVIANASGSAGAVFDNQGNATFAGVLTAKEIRADQIEGLNIFANQISSLDTQIHQLETPVASVAAIATESATPQLQDQVNLLSDQVASLSAIVIDQFATSSALPISTDFTSGAMATVSGDLRVQGNGLIEGVLNVVDTLVTQNTMVNGLADFFGNVVFHNNVTFQGQPTFNTNTAGVALVKQGQSQVSVTFSQAYANTPVVTASLVLPQDKNADGSVVDQSSIQQAILAAGYTYLVSNVTSSGFTIVLNKSAAQDMSFSWIALSVNSSALVPLSPTPMPIVLTPTIIPTLIPTPTISDSP